MPGSVVQHAELPLRDVPRIRTRILCDGTRAESMTIWEQWMEPEGHIPLHYHDVEEVLIFLAGQVELHIAGETRVVAAPANVVVPAEVVHGLKPASAETVHLLAMFPTTTPKLFAPDGTPRPMPWEDKHG